MIELIKGVDFLFWSTTVGVGYGQIMLEAILCGTEILCYLPVGDAKSLVKEQSYKSINEILERIRGNSDSKSITIPEYMNEKILETNHLSLFNQILKQ